MEFKVSGSGAESKTLNNENKEKTPAPAATGTSANDNTEAVITNNDTTKCRACQVGLSMSTGGGKSYMMMKALHETEEK